MSDRPILFSGPMVRALLDGRKTQTRRVLHVQPPEWVNYCEQPQMLNVLHQWVPSGLWRWAELDENQDLALRQWPTDAEGQHYWLRPRFAIGDRLWVRETFSFDWSWNGVAPRDVIPASAVYHWADGNLPPYGDWTKPKPSMFMPRWASRLTLLVTDVRVQRLHDIDEADAIAEGVEGFATIGGTAWRDYSGGDGFSVRDPGRPARRSYRTLWDSLNAKRDFGWNANPWVVALTFTVHHQNIDALCAREAA